MVNTFRENIFARYLVKEGLRLRLLPARNSEEDKITGYGIGADEYITIPLKQDVQQDIVALFLPCYSQFQSINP